MAGVSGRLFNCLCLDLGLECWHKAAVIFVLDLFLRDYFKDADLTHSHMHT